MATEVHELAKKALDGLPEAQAAQVLDFIHYLQWRREEENQSWFQSAEWQARYQESKEDLAAGRIRDFDDVEELLTELKGNASGAA